MYRKTFIGVIVSYLTILTIPLIIVNIIYVNTLKVTENQSNAYNSAMLTQIRDVMDGRLQEISRFTYQIVTNERLKKFLSYGKNMSNSQKYEMIQTVDNLTYYKDISPIIDQFYIYYFRSGVILTSSSIYQEDLFLKAAYNPNHMDVSNWVRDLKTRFYSRSYSPPTIGAPGMTSLDGIEYRQTLPSSSFDEQSAVLVVLLNKAKLVELLLNASIDPAGKIYVIDSADHIIATTDPNEQKHIAFAELPEQRGVLERTIDNVPIIISYQSSGYTHWKYVVEIPQEIFMEQANYIKVLTLRWLAIGACIGIVMVLILAYRNYGLIRYLVKTISKDLKTSPGSASSEKAYVVESINTIINQKERLSQNEVVMIRKTEELSQAINEQKHFVINGLLCQLLRDTSNDFDYALSSLSYYGIDLQKGTFCIAVAQSAAEQSTKLNRNSIMSNFQTILDDFILNNDDEYSLYLTLADDGSIIIIINVKNQVNTEPLADKTYQKAESIVSLLSKYSNCAYSSGIGSLHEGINHIQLTYREALKASDYAKLEGLPLVFYKDVQGANNLYNYSIEVELNIINRIKAGDFPGAKKLIDSVFEENTVHGKLPVELLRCLVFDIFSTIAKVINEMEIDDNSSIKKHSINDILQFKTIEEFHQRINELCMAASDYANANKKSHNELLKSGILDFIERNLTDNRLSVNYIADEFNITATYLSRFFKEQTSQNLLDYINRSRIIEAKTLLLNINTSVAEIAERIGYTNDTVLIRMFKKYEGTTPGRFRIDHSVCI